MQRVDLDARHQRRTAPSVTPATRCLRTRKANSSTGAAKTIADAATRPQSIVVPPTRPAMAGGAVRADSLEVRKIAKHELVPGEDQREHRGRRDARHEQRQREAPERLEPRVAVEHRGVLVLDGHLVDEALHHPDRERQVERRVDQDQPELRVDQAEVAVHQEDRDHDHDRRHEPGGEDEEELILLGLQREARVGPRRRHAEQRRQDRRGARDEHGVLERDGEVRRAGAAALDEHVLVVVERHVEAERTSPGPRRRRGRP